MNDDRINGMALRAIAAMFIVGALVLGAGRLLDAIAAPAAVAGATPTSTTSQLEAGVQPGEPRPPAVTPSSTPSADAPSSSTTTAATAGAPSTGTTVPADTNPPAATATGRPTTTAPAAPPTTPVAPTTTRAVPTTTTTASTTTTVRPPPSTTTTLRPTTTTTRRPVTTTTTTVTKLPPTTTTLAPTSTTTTRPPTTTTSTTTTTTSTTTTTTTSTTTTTLPPTTTTTTTTTTTLPDLPALKLHKFEGHDHGDEGEWEAHIKVEVRDEADDDAPFALVLITWSGEEAGEIFLEAGKDGKIDERLGLFSAPALTFRVGGVWLDGFVYTPALNEVSATIEVEGP